MLAVVNAKFTYLFGKFATYAYNAGSPFISPDNALIG
jgi:hypothetical protein